MPQASKRTGGCQCGKIQLTVTGEPMVTVNCHCLVCQRLSGSGHLFILVYGADNVMIEELGLAELEHNPRNNRIRAL